MDGIIHQILPWVNLLIVPAFCYIVKIERRLAKGDTLFHILEKACPVINVNSRCPKGGEIIGQTKKT